MQIVLLRPVWEDQQGIHCIFEVRGDEHESGAEGVLFGDGNATLHSQSTPEDVAEAVWEEALELKESGLASWELHNLVAPLVREREEQQ